MIEECNGGGFCAVESERAVSMGWAGTKSLLEQGGHLDELYISDEKEFSVNYRFNYHSRARYHLADCFVCVFCWQPWSLDALYEVMSQLYTTDGELTMIRLVLSMK